MILRRRRAELRAVAPRRGRVEVPPVDEAAALRVEAGRVRVGGRQVDRDRLADPWGAVVDAQADRTTQIRGWLGRVVGAERAVSGRARVVHVAVAHEVAVGAHRVGRGLGWCCRGGGRRSDGGRDDRCLRGGRGGARRRGVLGRRSCRGAVHRVDRIAPCVTRGKRDRARPRRPRPPPVRPCQPDVAACDVVRWRAPAHGSPGRWARFAGDEGVELLTQVVVERIAGVGHVTPPRHGPAGHGARRGHRGSGI